MSGLTGDWDKLINTLSGNPIKKAIDLSEKQIGLKGAGMVKRGIQSSAPGGNAFKPLMPFTVERKGSSKPLIDSGDLISSITGEPVNDGVWIGAMRGRKSKDGKDVVDIAAVHEFGCTIQVTPKMRAYLHSKGLHLKPTTQYIHIPERSYLRATLESPEFTEMCVDIVKANVKVVLKT